MILGVGVDLIIIGIIVLFFIVGMYGNYKSAKDRGMTMREYDQWEEKEKQRKQQERQKIYKAVKAKAIKKLTK